MKIAIDSGPLTRGHKTRGIGVHTRELIDEFKVKSQKSKVKIEGVDFSKADLSKYDIVHYPYFHPFFITLPFIKSAKKVVVTIHDLIPLIYPKHYPSGLKGALRFWLQKLLVRNVDAIITISETSKKDICRFLGVQPNKVHVVYLAPRKIFRKIINTTSLHSVRVKYSLPKDFVLYVGDINYNKNIPNLIKACKSVKLPLVICGKQALDIEELGGLEALLGPMDYIRYLLGKPHPELEHFKGILEEFKGNKSIIRLGYVPDGDLVAIYNLATLYCQPSFYEGFGLPVLEAFACGTPVVAAKTQALVEIAEGGAIFTDPRSPEDFARGITEILRNRKTRELLIENGSRIVNRFSWRKTARQTLNVYRNVYSNNE